MKKTILMLGIGISLSLSAQELLPTAKETAIVSVTKTKQLKDEIAQDSEIQEIIAQMLDMAALTIKKYSSEGVYKNAKLEMHYGNASGLLKKMDKYNVSKKYLIYEEFYSRLEKKGYKIEDKVFGGAIMETYIFW